MQRKLCVALLLLCVAAVIVKSETEIEIDENGDEYEVKRFYIEGRSLHDGRSQCVMTRRKRATVAEAIPDDSSDDSDEMVLVTTPRKKTHKKKNKKNKKEGNPADVQTSSTTPTTNIDTDTAKEQEQENTDADADKEQQQNEYKIGLMDAPNADEQDGDDEDDDYDGDDEGVHGEHTQYVQLPVSAHNNPQHLSVAVGTSAHAAASSANNNGLLLLQSHKVSNAINPETHSYLALEPISFLGVGADKPEEGDLLYNEELNPVTTTAIWSTGDNDDDLYDDLEDLDDLKPLKGPSNKIKKNKTNNKKRRPYNKRRGGVNNSSNNKRRRNNKNKNNMKNRNKNQRVRKRKNNRNRRRPAANRRRRLPANRPYRGNGVQRQRPQSSSQQGGKVHLNKLSNRRKNNNLNVNNNKRATTNKNNNNLDMKDQGTNTFTKTETMTQTGGPEDEKDVNCIIIHKETPTTARPFWNILGRDANTTDVRASGHFGQRKRANLRFAA